MNIPFEVCIDDFKNVEKFGVRIDGKNLVARVLPKSEWPADLTKELTEITHYQGAGEYKTEKLDKPVPVLEEPVYLYLFATPASDYKDLGKHIEELKTSTVSMGVFPTLRGYRVSGIKVDLEKDFFYDILAIGTHRGERIVTAGGRLSTKDEKVPYGLTLDEAKLAAIEHLGITQRQALNISTKVTYLSGWGAGGMVNAANFQFFEGKSGIHVYAHGFVDSEGCSKEELKKALHL